VVEALVFWLDFSRVGEALHSKTWRAHCVLTGVGVRYRTVGKLQMEVPVGKWRLTKKIRGIPSRAATITFVLDGN